MRLDRRRLAAAAEQWLRSSLPAQVLRMPRSVRPSKFLKSAAWRPKAGGKFAHSRAYRAKLSPAGIALHNNSPPYGCNITDPMCFPGLRERLRRDRPAPQMQQCEAWPPAWRQRQQCMQSGSPAQIFQHGCNSAICTPNPSGRAGEAVAR
jgi:hypothetical protein